MSGRVDIFGSVEDGLGDIRIFHRVGHDEVGIAPNDVFKRSLEVEIVMKHVLAAALELHQEIDVAPTGIEAVG